MDAFAKHPLYQLLALSIIVVALTAVVSMSLPFADDWHHTFRPVTLGLLAGDSPYDSDTFYNPPWALLPLVPVALLPESIGRGVLLVVAISALTLTAVRLGARPVALIFCLLSPPALQCYLTGNIDWMAMLGLVFPPQIGLFFLLIKPQIGGAVAVFWLIESFRRDGLKEVVRVFAPVTAALLLSFLIFGLWPIHFRRPVNSLWNASLWPISIPAGLALLVASVRTRNPRYAMGASPCLSPYLALQSWLGALFGLVQSTPETVAAVVGLWIAIAIRALGGGLT